MKLTPNELEPIRKRLEGLLNTKIKKRQIKAVELNSKYHWQANLYIEVGKSYSNLEPESPSEQVLAIFDATVFCIVTETRCLVKGLPYLFHREDVKKVIDQEPNQI